MFCKNCGKQIDDKAVICPYCGVPAETKKNNAASADDGNAIAIVGFVFSFLFALVGLICSIVGYNRAKKTGAPYKGLALAGIIISAISMVAAVILYIVLIAAVMAL